MLVVRDGHLLVLMRAEDDHPLFQGIWDVPGGIVERGEDARAAALRETAEETGLEVARCEVLRSWAHEWHDRERFRVTTFIGWEHHGTLRLSAEHSAHAWMTPEQILGQRFAEQQLQSPIFRSWLDGWAHDLRLFAGRVASESAAG